MAFLDELSKKLSGVSRVAVRKAKEVTDIGGLKIQIADENRKLNKVYENLGREYFDLYKDSPDEDLAGLVAQIKNALMKIEGLQEDISRVEAESAAQDEADRIRREAEAIAKKESVADAEMWEVVEDEEEASETAEEEAVEKAEAADAGETVSSEPTPASESPAGEAETEEEAGEAGEEPTGTTEEDKTEE